MNRMQIIQEMLHKNPDDPFLWHALALEHIKIGDDLSARSCFEDLLQKNPSYVGSYYHLAKLYERLQENTLAIKTYEHGLAEAKKLGDQHAFNELRSALDELL
jgi:tetratricopeptide (TPR) repeat protein